MAGHPRRPSAPGRCEQARRGMRLAADLDLPLVTVIDTRRRRSCRREAEEGGVAGEIARSIADMVALQIPTVCRTPRAGRRRWGARAPTCRPHPCRPTRMALPAPTRRGQRDPVSRHEPRRGHGGTTRGPVRRPVGGRHRRLRHPRIPRRRRRTRAVLPPRRRSHRETNSRHSETSTPQHDSLNANAVSNGSANVRRSGRRSETVHRTDYK